MISYFNSAVYFDFSFYTVLMSGVDVAIEDCEQLPKQLNVAGTNRKWKILIRSIGIFFFKHN